MGIVYKTTDRIKVEIDSILLIVAPLSYYQKKALQGVMIKATKGDMDAAMEAVRLAVKYSVKAVSGIKDTDGCDYSLTIENNELTDECVNDLLNMEESEKISAVASALLSKVPKEILGNDGKPIEGIKILPRNTEGK